MEALVALITGTFTVLVLIVKWLIKRSERRIVAQNTLEHQFNLEHLKANHVATTDNLDLLVQLQQSVTDISGVLRTQANITGAMQQTFEAHMRADEQTGREILSHLTQVDGRLEKLEEKNA